MPLDPKVLNSVVRVSTAGDLQGTGFIVGVMSETVPGKLWPYLITAQHVIRHQVLIEIQVPNPLTLGELSEPVAVDDWTQPFEDVDLAIAPFPFEAPEIPNYQSFPLDFFVPQGYVVPLGGPVHYLGMFAPLDIPMGRTGSLAALNVEIDKTDKYGNHYAYTADLVDCRSYDGFSGSPCISTLTYVVWDSEARELPIGVMPRTSTGAPLRLGNTAAIGRFCGMFTAHYDDENADGAVSRYGVGVMLPSEYIRMALMTDEMQEARRMADEADLAKKAASQPELKNVAITEPEEPDEFSGSRI